MALGADLNRGIAFQAPGLNNLLANEPSTLRRCNVRRPRSMAALATNAAVLTGPWRARHTMTGKAAEFKGRTQHPAELMLQILWLFFGKTRRQNKRAGRQEGVTSLEHGWSLQ